jgi:serine/threonine protein phosphatase PrpC
MHRSVRRETPVLDWHVASRSAEGQSVSGDLHLVQPFEGGVLLAVVDGVGHGSEASVAAHAAVAVLDEHEEEPVISLVQRCHGALRATRGVVMTLISLRLTESTITWIGVGNVEGRLLRADASGSHPSESVLLRGGLVGERLPALYASVVSVAPGDLLILASDGIHAGFDAAVVFGEKPRLIAERILASCFKGNDDGLVLVARFVGKQTAPSKRIPAASGS